MEKFCSCREKFFEIFKIKNLVIIILYIEMVVDDIVNLIEYIFV